PDMEVRIEIDLAKNSQGAFAGTFGQPAQGLKGLPLSTVTVEGTAVRFMVKADKEPAIFEGGIAADSKSISGSVSQAGYNIPFAMARAGDAKFTAVPKNAPIGKELEGTWNGTLALGERRMRLILKLANETGGASGTIMSPDGSGVEIPVGITQKGVNVTIEVP